MNQLSMRGKKITVFGHRGFIGTHAVSFAKKAGYDVVLPGRGEIPAGELGAVLYCIGLTADFREYPFETVEAHVCFLKKIISECRFNSFCYLSSTRIYMRCVGSVVDEDAAIMVRPSDSSDLYNLSKLMGESLCYATGRSKVKIARLSNIFGKGMSSDGFISSLIETARRDGRVVIGQSADSAKDYLHVDDAVKALFLILENGSSRLYNVAAGRNISHGAIANCLNACGVDVVFSPLSKTFDFPEISISRLRTEFPFMPAMGLCDFINSEMKGGII
jgi:nucleoside-diphosphate-sugar epimerase